MPELPSPKTIKDLVGNGQISPEMAAQMFQELHGQKGEVVVFDSHPNRFNAIIQRINEKKDYTFNHQLATDHYLDRKDLEEGIKHGIGLVAFGVTGILDGASEGVIYLATELLENVSYGTSRSIRRLAEGWERGKRG